MKIKICHISQSAGGVEAFILNILKHSDKNKFEHTVICYKNGTLHKTAEEYGANVVLVPMVREISPIRDLLSIIYVIKYLLKNKIDLIHAHSGKGGLIGRLCGHILDVPVFFTPHAFSYLGLSGYKRKLVMQVEKFLSFTNAYFLPSSLSEKERGVNEVKYKTKKVLEIFPNSVSIREYERTYIERDNLKVITLARLTYQKNPEMFLEVVKKVKEMAREINIEFIIIGGGYAGELEEMIMQKIEVFNLKKDIIIMPWLTADKVDEMLNDADIYLSTSRYEGLPTVLLLAMEKQIPIIATNVDGNKDVIFDTINGFLCENVTEIAEKIILLAKNKEIRKQMGCKAREILKQKFDIKENIRLLERLYGRYALQDGNYVIQ